MAKKAKPDGLAKMIGDAIGGLPVAATAFHDLASAEPESREELLANLHEVEVAADERYLKALRKTAGTFITPFDREDILLIVEAADDFVDQLDHVGTLLVGYKLGTLPDPLIAMANELIGATEQLAESVGLLKKQSKLEKHLFAINKHFADFDSAYRTLLIANLASDVERGPQTPGVVSLAIGLERACLRLNDLTRALGVAAIKET